MDVSKSKDGAIAIFIGKLADSDNEVRMTAAESLGNLLTGKKSPPRLIRSLQDPDELVRIEVCESLGAIGDRKALPALWRKMSDPSPLVRSYAAGAIGELGNNRDAAKLRKYLGLETSDTSRVGIYQALYRLGEHDVAEDVLSLLSKSRDYRVRCAAAGILSEIIADKSNASIILSALRKALRKEPTIAARSAIRAGIKRIKEADQ